MIPYILAAVGGYLIGQSRKETYADGGMMADGGQAKTGFITIAEMMREYFKFKRLNDNDYAFMDSDFDDFESGDYESLLGDVKDGVLKITSRGNTLLLDQNDDYHITFNGKKLATNDLFKEGDKYFFAKNNEYLTFKKNGKGMMWLDKDGKVSIATKGMDASHFVFMFRNKKDWENYQPSMMAKGGKVKSKKWIQDALSGGKNKGALRRTAAKKGLLRGDENLSKTDLKKLQKMGGTTAKRAHLAETLKKFDEGGDV